MVRDFARGTGLSFAPDLLPRAITGKRLYGVPGSSNSPRIQPVASLSGANALQESSGFLGFLEECLRPEAATERLASPFQCRTLTKKTCVLISLR